MRRVLAEVMILAAAALSPLEAQQGESPVTLEAPTPGRAPAGWAELIGAVAAYMDTNGIVGGSSLFLRDGRIVARRHFGFADRSTRRAVTDGTIFHWGSVTKTLTAIAILQLRDRGRLSLDDPVTRWIPELRQVHAPAGSVDSITIRMLLAHTAGFRGGTWPWRSGSSWEPFEPTTWDQLVAMMPWQALLFRPGERFSYSNPGYVYLARIIELVSGDPWESYVQKNLFTPLGLTRSYFRATPYHLAGDRSHGYDIITDSATGRDSLLDHGPDFDPGITVPNSGWNAPVLDLATYLAFLTDAAADGETLRRRRAVLPRATLEEMWRPVVAIGAPEAGDREEMGLGFRLTRAGGQVLVGHTGSQGGYQALVQFNPANRTAYILVFNTTRGDDWRGRAPQLALRMLAAAQRLLETGR